MDGAMRRVVIDAPARDNATATSAGRDVLRLARRRRGTASRLSVITSPCVLRERVSDDLREMFRQVKFGAQDLERRVLDANGPYRAVEHQRGTTDRRGAAVSRIWFCFPAFVFKVTETGEQRHATTSHNWRWLLRYVSLSRGRDGTDQPARGGRDAMTRYPAARRDEPVSCACVYVTTRR